MGVDVFQIADGLLDRILLGPIAMARSWRHGWRQGWARRGRGLAVAMDLLQLLKGPTGQGPKRLQGGPIEFLLLTQRRVLSDQAIMLSVEPLAIRALAGLFRHRSPLSIQIPSWHQGRPS